MQRNVENGHVIGGSRSCATVEDEEPDSLCGGPGGPPSEMSECAAQALYLPSLGERQPRSDEKRREAVAASSSENLISYFLSAAE